MGGVLRRIALFAMQSDEDARRAALVGVPETAIRVLGNTKFDEAARILSPEERMVLRDSLGIPQGVPVWVCGSTRPGEEAILADTITRLLPRFPDLRVVVAPRHLDRTGEAEVPFAACFPTLRRTKQRETQETTVRILILDTFGELASVYAVADVAFVGGSLLPFGGQSVFQPLAQGVPTLFGRHMSNQRDIAALAQSAGVGFVVGDADALAQEITRLLTLPPAEKEALTQNARNLIEGNRGVAARSVDAVLELLL